jgi:glycine/D-amino acid oxidase-like deaminating enzyme
VIRVAVLGAGIMGASTALFLARRGAHVTLFDQADHPFTRASRWNEGKIHLGYLYAADPSLDTARRLLPGGLTFRALTEELIGSSLESAITRGEETYLVHRSSVVDAAATEQYFEAVGALVDSHGRTREYLAPIVSARPRKLSRAELGRAYDTTDIVAGFSVPERSVHTNWVADRFVDALSAEPRVEARMATRVLSLRRCGPSPDSAMFVEGTNGTDGPFDYVVNALWEGRLALDVALGLPLPDTWSHRFRLSVFMRTAKDLADVPNTVVATGPFGDLKNYDGRTFYLSWYSSGLRAEGCDVRPPRIEPACPVDRQRVASEVIDHIGRIIPSVAVVRATAAEVRVEGGWVCACGRGRLDDPRSTLHRRDRVGIMRVGSYFSVDTGKYSIAPSLARDIADQIC